MAKIKALRVVSRASSFRRAGYQFSAAPTNIPLEDLTKEQISAISSDPALVAYEAEVEADEFEAAEVEGDKTPAAKTTTTTTTKKK